MRENRLPVLGTWLLASAVVCVTTILGGTAVTDAAPGIHGLPTGRTSAIAVRPKGEPGVTVVGGVRPAAPAPKAAEAKALKSKNSFMVPPPPATPCVLPPEMGFFLAQPPQQHAGQASPKTPDEAAAQETTTKQSDQELQAAEEELQSALRSSHATVDEWTR